MGEDIIEGHLNITFKNISMVIWYVKWRNIVFKGKLINGETENVKKLPRVQHKWETGKCKRF